MTSLENFVERHATSVYVQELYRRMIAAEEKVEVLEDLVTDLRAIDEQVAGDN